MKKGLSTILAGALGVLGGVAGVGYVKNKEINILTTKVDKFKSYYSMLNQWIMLKQEGKSLEQYFIDNNISSIAIYGMGEMGNRLYDELKDSNVEIKYAIDKNANNTYSDVEVFDLDSDLEEVDAIIVTAIFAFEQIEKEIGEVLDYQIINMEDIIYGM